MWLDKGVDALRIDTVKHMPNWFWQEFTCEMHTHKPNVFIFGEWIHNHPSQPGRRRFRQSFRHDRVRFRHVPGDSRLLRGQRRAGLPARAGHPQSGRQVYRNASELITFYENHDMPRLQSLGAQQRDARTRHLPHHDHARHPVPLLWLRAISPQRYRRRQRSLQSPHDGKVGQHHPCLPHHPAALGRARQKSRHPMGRPLAQNRGEGPLRFPAQIPAIALPRDFKQGPGAHHRPARHGTSRRHRTNAFSRARRSRSKTASSPASRSAPRNAASSVSSARGWRGSPSHACNSTASSPSRATLSSSSAIAPNSAHGTWPKACRLSTSIPIPGSPNSLSMKAPGQSIAYKFAVIHPGPDAAPGRENRPARRRAIAAEGVAKWRDSWEE